MATYFFDIDGTLTYESTNKLLPNVEEMLAELVLEGHQIIITTARPRIGSKKLIEQIAELTGNNDQCSVIFNVSSPRIIVNNEGAHAVKRRSDKAWTKEECRKLLSMGR